MSEVHEPRTSGEWRKFGIIVVVMLSSVLVVALSRPFIFGHVVPVILGEGLVAPLSGEQVKPPVPEENVEEEPAEELAEPSEAEADDSTAAQEQEDVVESAPTIPVTLTHIVKTGETLTEIAERYDVTMEAIVRANNLTSPNRINAGDELVIPGP